jgi:hypothetical protein
MLEKLVRKEPEHARKKHGAEQIVALLRQIEVELANHKNIGQACKEAGITQQGYYRWRKEYGGLKLEQARRLKALEKENSRLRGAKVRGGTQVNVARPRNRLPSGLQAASYTKSIWPRSASNSWPPDASETFTEWSQLPVAHPRPAAIVRSDRPWATALARCDGKTRPVSWRSLLLW